MTSYAEALARRQIDAARAARQEARRMDTTPTHAATGLTEHEVRLLDALAGLGATWHGVRDISQAYGWRASHSALYATTRRALYRLADRGLLRVSPKGKPPGASGLLFALTPAGHAAVIDAPPAWRLPVQP